MFVLPLQPAASATVGLSSGQARVDSEFVTRNARLLAKTVEGAGAVQVRVRVVTQEMCTEVPDMGWLFLEVCADGQYDELNLSFTVRRTAKNRLSRSDFDREAWASAPQDLAYRPGVRAASVAEAWAIACAFLSLVNPTRLSLSYGS